MHCDRYREQIRRGLDVQRFLLPLTSIPVKQNDAAWAARCEIAQAQICLLTKTWVGIRLLAADSGDGDRGGFRALVDLLYCGMPVKKAQLRAIMQLFALILRENLRCKSDDGRSFFYRSVRPAGLPFVRLFVRSLVDCENCALRWYIGCRNVV